MQYQVDKHIDDLEIEKKLVFIVKIESAKRMNKLKDEIQNIKEDKKVLVKVKDENNELKIERKKLNDVVDQTKEELKVKESEIEDLVKKVNFLIPKLEACLKEAQSSNYRIQLLEDEVSTFNFYKEKYNEIDEKLLDLNLLEEKRDSSTEKNKDLIDEVSENDLEIENLKETVGNKNKSFHSAASSLADELDNAKNRILRCPPCDNKS